MTEMNMRLFIFSLIILTTCPAIQAEDNLFTEGHSAYSIVLASDASLSEQTAAKELQAMLRKISGSTLPIVKEPVEKGIYIGWTPQAGVPHPDKTDESFTYKTIDDNLYIFGGSERGTMYGVFSFLERELGVHWYTSTFTKIPQRKQYTLPNLSHSEKPFIRHRLDFYYDALRHNDWATHNLLNTQYKFSQTPYGSMSSYWGIHTFQRLMPPSVYLTA